MFIGLASAFEEHVIDLREVSGTLEKKYGKPVELATRSTYNPLTKKQFALSDMRIPATTTRRCGPTSACPAARRPTRIW
jgi:multiple sugar transport system substrate-binding protein